MNAPHTPPTRADMTIPGEPRPEMPATNPEPRPEIPGGPGQPGPDADPQPTPAMPAPEMLPPTTGPDADPTAPRSPDAAP